MEREASMAGRCIRASRVPGNVKAREKEKGGYL